MHYKLETITENLIHIDLENKYVFPYLYFTNKPVYVQVQGVDVIITVAVNDLTCYRNIFRKVQENIKKNILS